MQSAEFSFSRAVSQSIQRSAAAADIDLLVLDNEDLVARALQNADVFMRERVDLVIESQTDARIANEIALKFSSLSVPVIALEIPQPGAVFFGANNAQAGLIAGRHLARWAETHWKSTIDELILLELPKAGHIPNARILGSMLGVLERLAWVSQDQIKVLHTTGHFDNAHTLVRRHLMHNKKKRILVAAINDPAAMGALQAFRDVGREDHCAIVGHNASSEIHAEIRQKDSPLIGSVGYFPERYGEGVIPIALNLLEGRRTSNINFIKHEMITAHNFDSYYPDSHKSRAQDRRRLPLHFDS